MPCPRFSSDVPLRTPVPLAMPSRDNVQRKTGESYVGLPSLHNGSSRSTDSSRMCFAMAAISCRRFITVCCGSRRLRFGRKRYARRRRGCRSANPPSFIYQSLSCQCPPMGLGHRHSGVEGEEIQFITFLYRMLHLVNFRKVRVFA